VGASGGLFEIDADAGALVPVVVSDAPVLASPPIGSLRVRRTGTALALALAPARCSGLSARDTTDPLPSPAGRTW